METNAKRILDAIRREVEDMKRELAAIKAPGKR